MLHLNMLQFFFFLVGNLLQFVTRTVLFLAMITDMHINYIAPSKQLLCVCNTNDYLFVILIVFRSIYECCQVHQR
jgi:hypothetical protein